MEGKSARLSQRPLLIRCQVLRLLQDKVRPCLSAAEVLIISRKQGKGCEDAALGQEDKNEQCPSYKVRSLHA